MTDLARPAATHGCDAVRAQMPVRVRADEMRVRVRRGESGGGLAGLEQECLAGLRQRFPAAARVLLAECGGVHTVALVAFDETPLLAWAADHGVPGTTLEEVVSSAACHEAVSGHVRALPTGGSTFRSVAIVGLLSVPAGHLTGTRAELLEEHADLVAQLWEASQRGIGRAVQRSGLRAGDLEHLGADPYVLLGVSADAGAEDLRLAYRRRARELHPDVNPDPAAADRFHAVSSAYRTLADPASRARADHDRRLAVDLAQRLPAPRSRPRRGDDVVVEVGPNLSTVGYEALQPCRDCGGGGVAPDGLVVGCQECGGHGHLVHVQDTRHGTHPTWRPCQGCHGYGSLATHPCAPCDGIGLRPAPRTVPVLVPGRLADGDRLVLAGLGHAGAHGGPAGDLYLVVADPGAALPRASADRPGGLRRLLRQR